MTIEELRWQDITQKKIRRKIWTEGSYLLVFGWEYAGTDFAYSPGASTPYGMLYVAEEDKRKPFNILPGHKGTDWEILDVPPTNAD